MKVKIGDFLESARNALTIESNVEYKQVTVRMNNQGVCLRGTKKGEDIKTKRQFLVESGQFILSKIDARNGAFGIVPDQLEGAIATQDFPVFSINTNIISKDYLLLLSRSDSFLELMVKSSSGTTNRKRLNQSKFLDISITLPPLSEQLVIIEKYQKLNKIVSKLNQFVDKNIEYSSFLPNSIAEMMLHLSNTSTTDNALPSKWKWVPLKELGETGTGTTPSTSNASFYGGDIPFIKPGDILDGKIDYNNQQITNEGLANGRLVDKNSILMVCIGGSIGKVAITDRRVSCNQQINYIHPIIDNNFLFFVMNTPYFQKQLKLKSKGTATPIINKSNWESILIPVPTNTEILKISSSLKVIRENQLEVLSKLQNIKTIVSKMDRSFFQYV